MKKSLFQLAFWMGIMGVLAGCETVIDAKLDTTPTQLAVEATLTDQPGPQHIRLTQTAPYLLNQPTPAATGATVRVVDDSSRTYTFTDPDNDGTYTWTPTNRDTLGRIGHTYQLTIDYQQDTYKAAAKMYRSTPIDSVTFTSERINPLSDKRGYQAELFARDPAGAIDYTRIRYSRNGVWQSRPRQIILAQNGSFEGSADTDGLIFIRPIRQSVNPDSLYTLNDVVRVEIGSLSPEGYRFFQALRTQLTNEGLFATPPANLPTNVVNQNPNGRAATGFFMMTAIRSKEVIVANPNLR